MSDLNQAIQKIEMQIRALQTDLAALHRARAIVEKERAIQSPSSSAKHRPKSKKKMSAVNLALTVLREAGGPLHIDDILKSIELMNVRRVPTKASLSSTLARYAKKHKLFVRGDKPNSFALISDIAPIRSAAA